MEAESTASENHLFSNKDTFLNLTIFLSIKAICRLRRVCRLFNQWLSDLQTNFAWKIKIQNAFPNTYEAILKHPWEQQIQMLLEFDSLVDEGHFVSCFNYPDQLNLGEFGKQTIKQIPWLKNTFVIDNHSSIFLYSPLTAVHKATPRPFEQITRILMDIKEKKIAFADDENLAMYRIENNALVHEFTKTNNPLYGEILPQIYGDHVIEKVSNDDGVLYTFRSISSGSETKEISFRASECLEQLSKLDPVLYICYRDTDYDGIYHIVELDCLTQCERRLGSGRLQLSDDFDHRIMRVKLAENGNGKYLHIYQGEDDKFIEIFDLTNCKMIYSGVYEEVVATYLFNPGTPYICKYDETQLSTLGQVKIERILQIKNTVEENEESDEKGNVVDSIKESWRYIIRGMKWLNEDIVTFTVLENPKGHRNYPPMRQVFLSAKKRKVIGNINGKMKVFALDREKVVCFCFRPDDVRFIHLDMSYLDTEPNNAKRKLPDDDAATEHSAKKCKINP